MADYQLHDDNAGDFQLLATGQAESGGDPGGGGGDGSPTPADKTIKFRAIVEGTITVKEIRG